MPSRHVVREVVFGMLFFLLLPFLASAASCEDADVIVRGAQIVTMDSAHPFVSGHLAAANSAALALAGITRNTRDPQGGVIERDAAGEPTGVVKDTAMQLVANFLPSDPPDINIQAAKLI